MKKLKKNKMETANIFSILTYRWMNDFFKDGYNRTLEETDMFELVESDSSKENCSKLERNWEREMNNKNKAPSLLRALMLTYKDSIIIGGILAFVQEFFRLGFTIIVAYLIAYFEEKDNVSLWQAYALAAAVAVSAIVVGFLHHQVFFWNFRIGWHMRTSLCALMYKKSLRLSQKSLNGITTGKIVNLGATDVLRFDFFPPFVHYCWIGPLLCVSATAILWREFGVAVLAGMGTLFLVMLSLALSGKLFAKFRASIAVLTDNRVRWMNEVIVGMRIIKMCTWEKPFSKILSDARRKEVLKILQTASVKASNMAFFMTQEKIVTLATISAYVLTGGTLTTFKVFLLIGILGALRLSAGGAFLLCIEKSSEAYTSTKRIQEEKDDESELTLDDISFQVLPGELLAVVGPVGAGKSSLLSAILGELPALSGEVTACGKVSYAGQTPWVFSGTVRENILFGDDFDEQKYKKVISACCLVKDLKNLPNGDLTLVGERGVTLSGGQKARLNLARAAYRSESSICLLDDPLSAVDPPVARHIFSQCISGLMKDKVRVLVTHQVQLLKTADKIIILKKGKIEGCGTYEQLKRSHIDFETLLKPKHDGSKLQESKSPRSSDLQKIKLIRDLSRASQRSVASTLSFGAEIFEEEVIPTEPEEEREQGSIGTKVYAEYLRLGRENLFHIVLILLILASHILHIMNDWWLALWTTNYTAYEGNRPTANSTAFNSSAIPFSTALSQDEEFDNMLYFKLYAVLTVSVVVSTLLRLLMNMYLCVSSGIHMHKKMIRAILRAPIRFFDTNPAGRILNRFSKDMGQVDELLPITFLEFLYICGQCLSVVILVTSINYLALIIIVPSVIYFIWLRRYYIRTSRDIKRLEGACRSPVFSLLSTTLQGLTTVRGFGAQSRFEMRFHETQDLHGASWFLFLTSSRWFGIRLDIITSAFIGTIAFASVVAASVLNLDAGKVGLILTHTASVVAIFQWGVRQSAEVENLMTSVERIQQYYKIPPEAPHEIPEKKPHDNWPLKGSIEFKRMSFAYYEDGPIVLKNLNFKIHPQEKIGLVGRTGAGKSSVISALFRLAEFASGEIYIDGIAISKIGLLDLRSVISIIPQDPMLFCGTLRKNLDLFNSYSDNDIWDVIMQVQLYDFVLSLPEQLNTELAESGSNFSVGQRQLICLARALLCKNKILLIDEATANVDMQTDRLIQGTLRDKFADCTVITIAHRINTIIDSDRIIVLEAGETIEFDAPHDLLQRQKGTFSMMVDAMGQSESEALRQKAKSVYDAKRRDIVKEE